MEVDGRGDSRRRAERISSSVPMDGGLCSSGDDVRILGRRRELKISCDALSHGPFSSSSSPYIIIPKASIPAKRRFPSPIATSYQPKAGHTSGVSGQAVTDKTSPDHPNSSPQSTTSHHLAAPQTPPCYCYYSCDSLTVCTPAANVVGLVPLLLLMQSLLMSS